MNEYQIKKGYDQVARKYASAFFNELEDKPLDKYILNAFANLIDKNGLVCDLGCGPGQIARYLKDLDIETMGIDLSLEMVAVAQEMNPDIFFKEDNMLALSLEDGSLSGAVSFYSLVHFGYDEIERVAKEIYRTLKSDGKFLTAFHAGDYLLHVDSLLDETVDMDYVFFDTDKIVEIFKGVGFQMIEVFTRYPYDNKEYGSMRGYILCRK